MSEEWKKLSPFVETPEFEQSKQEALAYGIHLEVPFEYGRYLEARVGNNYCDGMDSYLTVCKAWGNGPASWASGESGPKSLAWYLNLDCCVEISCHVTWPLLKLAYGREPIIVEFDEGNHYVAAFYPEGPYYDLQVINDFVRVPTGKWWSLSEFKETETYTNYDIPEVCDYTYTEEMMQEMSDYAHNGAEMRVGDFLNTRMTKTTDEDHDL